MTSFERIFITPPESIQGRHFGPGRVRYLLYQHHHCQVTEGLLLEQLREWGIDICAGQINALLLGDKEGFHTENDELLATGLAGSSYVTVDDTDSRHQGKTAMRPALATTSLPGSRARGPRAGSISSGS